MKALFLDFETYWDEDYTLKKMTPAEYVADPRFEALGCAFIDEDDRREWVDGPDLPRKFASIDWDDTYALSHNALFDMLILSMRYNVQPRMYGCTLSMARNWLSHMIGSSSLEAVSAFYGFPPKWKTAGKFKGISFAMLAQMPELHRETAEYAIDDTAKCKQIFINIMADGFPKRELYVIDLVVRMAARPTLQFDQEALALHLGEVLAKKQALLDRAQLTDRDNLMRDEVFATMLMLEGVAPPMKRSPSNPDKQIYAFAKTDKEFKALEDHENPMVQALVAARLGHKSTLEESRTQRMLNISKVCLFAPVPLKYSGAHTHRFSGDWLINLQNLPRGGRLRGAVKAPKGKKIVAVDAMQIEARMNATLSQQWDLVDEFRRGIDVYAKFAEVIYQHPVSKDANPVQRFVGKTGILSLGYGSSWVVFQAMCRNQGDVHLTDSEATSIVFLYRQRYKQIVQNWEYADKFVLPMLETGEPGEWARNMMPFLSENWAVWGPIGILKNKLSLPSGNFLRYRDLHKEVREFKNTWMFMRGKMPQHIYGAKVVENVIQALAFIHIMEVALRIFEQTSGLLWPAHQVHDELLYCVDDAIAEPTRDLVVAEMSRPPVWMPMAPLAAEGHIGQTYLDAK